MATVLYLDKLRPARPVAQPEGDRKPVAEMLSELARDAGELSEDWLFQAVSEPTKRRMLAERGLAVA